MKVNFKNIVIVCVVVLILPSALLAVSGSIKGRVVDAESGQVLPGANVYLEGTNIGTATDIGGEYSILNIPPGIYTLVVNYIGFGKKEVQVRVLLNETIEQNIELDYTVLTGQNVVITAQARGQTEAINQQIASRTVKNVVSSTKIQELPEANAAEAVGRLPGVSLERDGGEGTKVMIRGMGAKYTKIQIDGVDMAATGDEDRSADLSMISPYMLEGIELTKSVMANQEATATGGIVNFKIRKASDEPSFNVIVQGGHNDLRDTYNDYKVSVGGSNRFFEKKFGIYTQIDYEQKEAGSQQFGGVTFIQENETAPVRTNGMQLMDIFRNVERLGATMVLDFVLPNTEIKSSNFFSRIKREETSFITNYGYDQQNISMSYSDTPQRWLTVLTNSLQIDHQWRNWKINSAFSHSYSENILPARIGSGSGIPYTNPFPIGRKANYNVNLDPETIPDSLVIPIKEMDENIKFMTLPGVDHEESKTLERDLAGELNFTYNLNFTDQFNVKLNFGSKYRYKTKKYNLTNLSAHNEGASQEYRNLIYEHFEDRLSERAKAAWKENNMRLYMYDFLDHNYQGETFFDGRYDFGYIFDKDIFREIHEFIIEDAKTIGNSMYDLVQEDFVSSVYKDYHGNEEYVAYYLMPEIDFTQKFTLVPGIRYESNRTEYTGYRGSRLGVLRNETVTRVDTVTKARYNEFLLPMIQAVYRPTDWLNIKAGYTHTLQRPNYNDIMPGWVIGFQGTIENLSNFRLKPEKSENWDFQVSVYSNKLGLFSAGLFYKKIKDMIFWTGQTVILDTAFFELPTIMHRQRAAYATNNKNLAVNYGYEIEWQSNFWYLPGLLSGLVLNFNYTRNESEAKYLRSTVNTTIDPITYKATLFSKDTTFTAPMINQPDHLLNLTVGYDFKGFSIRGAMRYKSKIFTSNDWHEKLRGYSVDFYRYDLSIKQQLPFDGLEFFLNINNITNEIEHSVINHMNFTSDIEDYGRSANVGFRYRL